MLHTRASPERNKPPATTIASPADFRFALISLRWRTCLPADNETFLHHKQLLRSGISATREKTVVLSEARTRPRVRNVKQPPSNKIMYIEYKTAIKTIQRSEMRNDLIKLLSSYNLSQCGGFRESPQALAPSTVVLKLSKRSFRRTINVLEISIALRAI